jgi:uncharacterized protein (DUF488 family)
MRSTGGAAAAGRSSDVCSPRPPDDPEARAGGVAPPCTSGPGFLTIGYEGRTPDGFLGVLRDAGVTLLCDVRNNPWSRKPGFSKRTLAQACAAAGIRYEHLPELGIPQEQRQGLTTPAEHATLFTTYEADTIPRQGAALARIARWVLEENQRVALLCLERLPQDCHRHCIADALTQRFGPALAPVHL